MDMFRIFPAGHPEFEVRPVGMVRLFCGLDPVSSPLAVSPASPADDGTCRTWLTVCLTPTTVTRQQPSLVTLLGGASLGSRTESGSRGPQQHAKRQPRSNDAHCQRARHELDHVQEGALLS